MYKNYHKTEKDFDYFKSILQKKKQQNNNFQFCLRGISVHKKFKFSQIKLYTKHH